MWIIIRGGFRPAGVQVPGGRVRSAFQCEEGAELVEFAIASSILFTFFLGVLELCLVLFAYNTTAEAARNAARWAATRGVMSCAAQNSTCVPTPTQFTNYVQTLPGASQFAAVAQWCTNSTTCSASAANAVPGNLVQVKITYTLASIPFVTDNSLSISSTAQMVIWQ